MLDDDDEDITPAPKAAAPVVKKAGNAGLFGSDDEEDGAYCLIVINAIF